MEYAVIWVRLCHSNERNWSHLILASISRHQWTSPLLLLKVFIHQFFALLLWFSLWDRYDSPSPRFLCEWNIVTFGWAEVAPVTGSLETSVNRLSYRLDFFGAWCLCHWDNWEVLLLVLALAFYCWTKFWVHMALVLAGEKWFWVYMALVLAGERFGVGIYDLRGWTRADILLMDNHYLFSFVI